MDKRQKAIQAMHRGGMTYDEIGKMLGVSRQRVHQIAKRRSDGKQFHRRVVERIPYIGLREWMLANRVSVSEMQRRCGLAFDASGKHQIKADVAERILEITGLSFEECFRRY